MNKYDSIEKQAEDFVDDCVHKRIIADFDSLKDFLKFIKNREPEPVKKNTITYTGKIRPE